VNELAALLAAPRVNSGLNGVPCLESSSAPVCGLVFGVIDVAIMLPMSFPDKKPAITAPFIARFGIGFAVGAGPIYPGLAGRLACVSVDCSASPDALITKAYAPIIGIFLVHRFGEQVLSSASEIWVGDHPRDPAFDASLDRPVVRFFPVRRVVRSQASV
jgi:hypothetical protein